MHKMLLLVALCSCCSLVRGQFHEPVLPGLEGSELIQALQDQYKPASILDYGDARDTLYARIYQRNDSIFCVYSGHGLRLPSGVDPSQYLAQFGNNGINTEHVFPQSKGAGDGNARSDMHNLYPTRAFVNSERSNAPYAEIPDNETEKWYFKTKLFFAPPSINRDLYSEKLGDFGDEEFFFEPREDFKGNAARSMFYWYTMYRQEANASNDPTFFNRQRTTICEWHFLDPVDSLEWVQNQQKAIYQSGKPNPFILDCTLPERTYCADLPLRCVVTNISSPGRQGLQIPVSNYPNPVIFQTRFTFTIPDNGHVRLDILDPLGNLLDRPVDETHEPGVYHFDWKVPSHIQAGSLLFYRLTFRGSGKSATVTDRVVFLGRQG